MRLRLILASVFVCALSAAAADARETVLRAEDVAISTNVDWLALARAGQRVRTGRPVRFVLPPATNIPCSRIRCALWLAALHGITDLCFADAQTARIFEEEKTLAVKTARNPFFISAGVRDTPTAPVLFSALCDAQVFPAYLGPDERSDLAIVLQSSGSEILDERSGVRYPSLHLVVTATRACHADRVLLCEPDGAIARDVFLRLFRDGRAVVVNLSPAARPGLILRRGLARTDFDMQPHGVLVLNLAPHGPTLSRNLHEPFSSSLWQISFEGRPTQRLVRADLLPSVVDETDRGKIRYCASVSVPPGEEALYLHVETNGELVELVIGGVQFGTRAWAPFEWLMPSGCRGRTMPFEIIVDKQSLDGYLQKPPSWRRN